MDSEENEIEENMFAIISKHEESETDPDTPPPSPLRNQNKPGFFSLTQVSMKITEFISSAQKKVFGEDYWIPTDSYEVVEFPAELLVAHKVVYPMDLHEKSRPTLKVVQGTFKNAPGQPLHHVVYTSKYEQHRISWTIFRSNDLGEAVDFCRRCEDCRILLKMMDKGKDFRRTIREMTNQFQFHPLWRMVHIAIACRRVDVFTDEGLTTLKENGYSLNEITNTVSTPEGKYPLMIAIETQQPEIVKFLLNHGADPSARDMNGNNALHYAALASVQMIEIVWEDPRSKVLLNSVNDDHVTPVLLCIRNANPRCLATLLGYGAELNLRTTGRNPLFEAMQSRGKTTDVIRQLLAASPNLVHERDQSGNTVLHVAMYKNSLMGLLYLQARQLDLNIRNKAGQTPLHVYTTRDELGMVITMASYGCDLNATNLNGDTALHIAVSHRYLEISRFLLSVGADPNLVNKHGESPRHMAAKLNETQLLKSLIICGAKRCPPVKSGCVSGCVNSKSIQMLSSRVTSESGPSPRSFADLEKIENRKFDSVGHGNFIQQYIQDNIYEEMIEKLQFIADQKSENPDTDYINLLSMDGGGIRGLVIVQILVEIEKLFGESIFKYFDWIAGTSTGALVASGLCQGKSCRDCQMIYLRFKDMVFDGWVRPYSANALETFMQTEVGNTTTMSDIRWPRLMITTVRADVFPVQLEIMRNYQLPLTISENIQLGFDNPDDLQLWRALRRTSAAPTFFPNAENKYIDGGIISNNPLLDLLTEVDLWNSTNQYKGYSQRVKVGCILSIGTGVIPTIPLDPNTLEISANPVNAAVAIKNLGVIIVDQATATEGAPVARALSWCSTSRTPFFRLSSPLFKDISMDTTNDHDLARMMWECVEYVYENQAYIDKMVTLLRKIGPSNRRKHLFQPPNLKYCNMQTQTSAPDSPEGPPLFI